MKLSEQNRLAEELGLPSITAYRAGVIVIHGMNSHAYWQKDIVGPLQDYGIKYIPKHYGRLLGGVILRSTANRLAERVVAGCEELGGYALDPCMIGHSYGTRLVGTALERNPTLRIKRLVLVGGCLPRDFPWNDFRSSGQIQDVLNEICPRDPWPKKARRFIPSTGSSGCCGFMPGTFVQERSYGFTGHSGLLTVLHCKRAWVPFLLDGKLPAQAVTKTCKKRRCPSKTS